MRLIVEAGPDCQTCWMKQLGTLVVVVEEHLKRTYDLELLSCGSFVIAKYSAFVHNDNTKSVKHNQ